MEENVPNGEPSSGKDPSDLEVQKAWERLQAARDLLTKDYKARRGLSQQSQQLKPSPYCPPMEPSARGVVVNNNGINEESAYFDFDNDEFINLEEFDDSDEAQWLLPTMSGGDGQPIDLDELEADRSYMDIDMLDQQNSLVNSIKREMFEQATMNTIEKSRDLFRTFYQYQFNNVDRSTSTTNAPISNNVDRSTSTSNTSLLPQNSNSSVCVLFKSQKMSLDSSSDSVETEPPNLPMLASSPLASRLASLDINDVFTESEINSNSPNYIGTPPRHIDTRTYTRPKKARMPLEPQSGAFNNTLTITRTHSVFAKEGCPNKNSNLNETFTQKESPNFTGNGVDSAPMNTTITIDHNNRQSSRSLARNESYVICKSPTENVSPRDINSTFTCANDSPLSNTPEAVHNLSMEELHVIARLQEQSLKNMVPSPRTLERKETRVLATFPTYDGRRNSRTSSTDTYSVEQSNPSSGSSVSELSESKSEENLQGDAIRRSMPELVRRRSSGVMPPSLSLAPQLKSKPYHTSETRLSNLSKSHLSLLQKRQTSTNIPSSRNARTISPDVLSSRSSTCGSQSSNEGRPKVSEARSGLGQPKGHYAASQSRGAPPRPSTRPASFLQPPRFSSTGAGSGLPRPQSRIPAPPLSTVTSRPRLTRPSTAGPQAHASSSQNFDWKDGCY